MEDQNNQNPLSSDQQLPLQNPIPNEPNTQPASTPSIVPTNISADNQTITPNTQPPQPVNAQNDSSQPQPIITEALPIITAPITPKPNMNKKLLVIVIVVLAVVLVGAALAYSLLEKKPTTSKTNNSSSSASSVSFSCTSEATTKADYTSSSGGFSAWFPVTPSESQDTSQLTLPDGTKLDNGSSWVYDANNSFGIPGYEVDEYAMPIGDSFTASQIADYSIKSTLLIAGSKVICSSPSKSGGLPAETFAVYTPASTDADSPNTYTYSIITVNHNNIYDIGMATMQQNDPTAIKFLGSFSFNN